MVINLVFFENKMITNDYLDNEFKQVIRKIEIFHQTGKLSIFYLKMKE